MPLASPSTAGFVVLVGSLILAACGAGPESGEFEVGTGTWRFESVVDGQPVDLVRGAQGGWHVWVSVRATDVANGDTLTLETLPANGSRPTPVSYTHLTLPTTPYV